MADSSWTREPSDDRTLEDNWLFQLRRERYRSRRSGLAHDYYVMHLADAVNVIALTTDRQVVLVRQFRAGSETDSLETPGGLIDEGEDAVAAGIRELLEETGYAGDTPWVLGTVWANPSILTSRMTTLVIFNAEPVSKPRLDQGEEVEVVLVPSRDVPAMIRDGKINHALVVAGLLWWMAAELPETPLATLPEDRPPWYQFKLRTLVGLVVISAGAFGLLRNFGVPISVAIAFAVSVPASNVVISKGLDVPSTAVLVSRNLVNARGALRALAVLGLSGVIWAMLLMTLKLLHIL